MIKRHSPLRRSTLQESARLSMRQTRPYEKILGITLGIMTALGGFVDLGQIVFTTQAGALFGYQLMWAIALGTAAIIICMEMKLLPRLWLWRHSS